jgi:hypothetical protein
MSCAQRCPYGVCSLCLAALSAAGAPSTHSARCQPLGVSPAFLKEFKAKWGGVTGGWSTAQVCHQLVKPLTSRSRRSVCEDLMSASVGGAHVGVPTLVLSHCWGNLFQDTVDAALQAADDAAAGAKVGGGGHRDDKDSSSTSCEWQ